jgi:hypothetical protein
MPVRALTTFALRFVIALAAAAQTPAATAPAAGGRAEILVLGTYHMANPGHDVFNLRADDVLAPRRQAEIAELMAVLEKFRPTRIAVESELGDDRVPKLYADYLAGKHDLTRNEIEQIGFRLARELGHATVYPVDVEGDFPYQRVLDYTRAKGRSAEFSTMSDEVGERVKALNAFLAGHTVLETLLDVNSEESVGRDMAWYFRQARFGEPGDWAGPDLVADWYRRNIRIYANILHLADSPAERVLVIFGYGHLGWLRQDVAANPDLHLRKLAEFAQ